MRGGGRGFFAAATRYELTLYEAPRVVRSLMIDFELESVPIVSQWVDQAIHSVHPSAEVITVLSPAGNGNPPLVSIAAFAMANTAAEASDRLGRLREPPPAARRVGDIREDSSSFADLMKGDGGFPSGKRMAGDMRFCETSMPPLMAALKPFAESGSAAPSFLMCVLFGRKSLLPLQGEAAFRMAGPHYVGVYSFYDESSEDRQQLSWVRSAIRAIEPYVVGSYISEVDLSADADIARKCYSAATWQRLQALRAKYDPGNVFFGFA